MPRLDANVILRYLTDEPADQAQQVGRLFHRLAVGEAGVIVDAIVVAEVVGTLSSFYKIPRADIAEALLQLLSHEGIECQDAEAVRAALVLFEEKSIDFVDALLCARMLQAGEPYIYSFDRDFDKVEGIRRLEPA